MVYVDVIVIVNSWVTHQVGNVGASVKRKKK